ncbi:MFS transporter [Streptomyces sp. NPDC097619]|uniref:MFS transporter n=1 Tax=Streptomyces sp. NPDC097619 TaxID=3157228 RepID=UPI00332A14B2
MSRSAPRVLPPPPPARPRGSGTARTPARRAVLAGAFGNFTEWYEFGVYGAFATVIADRFFAPAGTDTAALTGTYAAFALAFFFRPLGALLFGRIADREGRRPALLLTIALMTAATTLIGLLPTHDTAGAAAPWLLTALRAVQGLAAGGEFGGSVSLLTESAPPGRRGRRGAWQSLTVALGLLAGTTTAVTLALLLGEQALYAWGWRLPFLLALPLGLTALRLRRDLPETAPPRTAPTTAPAADRTPSRAPTAAGPAVGTRGRGPRLAPTIALGIARVMGWSAAGYTFLVVLPAHLQTTLGTGFGRAQAAGLLTTLGFAAAILPAGILSDRTGRRAVTTTGCALVVLLAVPFLRLLRDPAAPHTGKAAALLLAGAVLGLLAGPGPALLAEMFPTEVRSTGLGLAYALSNAVFSGCAGLTVTLLTRWTGHPDVPALYAAACCALSLPALLTLRPDDHLRPL